MRDSGRGCIHWFVRAMPRSVGVLLDGAEGDVSRLRSSLKYISSIEGRLKICVRRARRALGRTKKRCGHRRLLRRWLHLPVTVGKVPVAGWEEALFEEKERTLAFGGKGVTELSSAVWSMVHSGEEMFSI